ncbi:MAG: DUF3465 domain-containing protein [Bdellovibrio sp.]
MKLQAFLVGILTLLSFKICLAMPQEPNPGQVNDDSTLVAAISAHRSVFYLEAGNLQVIRILREDDQGLPHEKWIARTSNGQTIMIVYNLDMGNPVPIQVGDRFSVGGQFIWTDRGALIHWTHEDPRRTHPNGYVYLNGTVYGDSEDSN